MSAQHDPAAIGLCAGGADPAQPAGAATAGVLAAITVPGRCNGPLTSGNGGWTAGALARHLPPGPVSVSLRAPVPLERAMHLLAWPEGPGLQLRDGQTLVAEAAPAALDVALPLVPSVEDCQAAAVLGRLRQSARPADSAYARCVVCGFARNDGLRLSPGPVDDAEGTMATLWVPSPATGSDTGAAVGAAGDPVSPEWVWAALDCPAGMAWGPRLADDDAVVTARITLAIDQPVRIGGRYRLLAWPVARDGRKLHAGSALIDDDGQVCARSLQLWLIAR